ncbi:acetyltransferase [Bacillus alkalicellulosilyticus]|uniref:acetyltransferase n=1 Tax=Alkalihalobacterium alkalicellulosilyticum TaxID=1912214 RepID=UPI0009968BB4|nr:acetyltransferase [Bacillus alkalicellulosilyticus]
MQIAIIGNGGHGKVIRDIINSYDNYQIIGYFDDKYEDLLITDEMYYGPIRFVEKLVDYFDDISFVIAVGNNRIRQLIVDSLSLRNDQYISLIHKTAVISPTAQIGFGTVIMANAVVNADAQIGNHTILNTGSIVEHDATIDDFVHLCPKATITGTVHIGEGVQVGANATVVPNITIGEWSVIGAGAVVISDTPSNCTSVGVPAKVRVNEKTGGA